MENEITQQDIEEWVRHWLSTPINTYLGSDYGFDKQVLLHTPLSENNANEMIAKLRRDVPVLSIVPDGEINIFSIPVPPDKLQIIIQIGNITVGID